MLQPFYRGIHCYCVATLQQASKPVVPSARGQKGTNYFAGGEHEGSMIHDNVDTSSALTAADVAIRTGPTDWSDPEEYLPEDALTALEEFDSDTDGADPKVTDVIDHPAAVIMEIQQATQRGWVDIRYGSPAFQGLNILVAWLLSAGRIERDYTPVFEIRHGTDYERLDRAFDRVGCEYTRLDGPRLRVRPGEASATLGRVLVTLGVPRGEPDTRTVLPSYLSECPDPLRRTFARTYLNNRARRADSDPPAPEQRSPAFRRAMAAFLTQTTGERVKAAESGLVVPTGLPGALY